MDRTLGYTFASFSQQAKFQTYFQVAITVAVLYDHLITLDVEIDLIWKKKWSAVKVLFVINRYFGEALPLYLARVLIHQFPPKDNVVQECKIASKVQGWGSHVIIWSMQAIMLYRICCLFNRSKKVTIWMSIAFGLEIISLVVIDALYSRSLSPHSGSNVSSPPPPGPPSGPPGPPPPYLPSPRGLNLGIANTESQQRFPICLAFSPSWYFISWAPIFAFELLILLMGLRAGIRYFKKEKRSLLSLNKFPFHSILLRDSILFPMIAFLVGILNILGWAQPTNYYMPIANGLAQLFSRILGCRLILNLREAYYLPFEGECGQPEKLPTLIFPDTDVASGAVD
ncbi:hypothetical protein K443DRAFT_683451 [Laccaria amethystina LaAM-08-1]|uniref:DUF6533 domain-containing protein n=1 Tax=Laccaria amethystina LaAM-08-1 TaxID=1095629 RepID=A0A0C9WJJ8_9AGAR|nr:hypothetical protein K443DRAFT_683451 [Laccaria amethystina LaAM-08-1]